MTVAQTGTVAEVLFDLEGIRYQVNRLKQRVTAVDPIAEEKLFYLEIAIRLEVFDLLQHLREDGAR